MAVGHAIGVVYDAWKSCDIRELVIYLPVHLLYNALCAEYAPGHAHAFLEGCRYFPYCVAYLLYSIRYCHFLFLHSHFNEKSFIVMQRNIVVLVSLLTICE